MQVGTYSFVGGIISISASEILNDRSPIIVVSNISHDVWRIWRSLVKQEHTSPDFFVILAVKPSNAMKDRSLPSLPRFD
jgi:hypothetical protein